MKKTTLTLAILGAFCALLYAGPEPMASKEIAPAPPPPPESCFAGWYIGIHGGVTYETSDNHTFIEAQTHNPGNTFYDAERDHGFDSWGRAGGGHFGWNFQRGMFVFGLEADISGANMHKDAGDATARLGVPLLCQEDDDDDCEDRGGPGPVRLRAHSESTTTLNWYATVRPRFGFAFLNSRAMAFVTGGLAVGQADFHLLNRIAYRFPSDEGVTRERRERIGDEDARIGWTAGGGFDFCVAPHIILNLQYLFIDLGDVDDAHMRPFDPVRGGPGNRFGVDFINAHASSEVNYHILQAGVSFLF